MRRRDASAGSASQRNDGNSNECTGWPEYKHARPVPSGVKCQREGCEGELVPRRAKGRRFFGCSTYPTCRFTAQRLPKPETEEGNGEAEGTV